LRNARKVNQVTRNKPLIDVGIGLLLALFILIISPGAAIVAILGLLVLAACGFSFVRRARRQRASSRVR
jgi:hypothetical protein